MHVDEETINYSVASKAIIDFYVDDVITGCNTIVETIELKTRLIKMMKSLGFELHKWATNDKRIIQDIPEEKQEKFKLFQEEDTSNIKTLGLAWQSEQYCFTFTTTWPDTSEKITKRKSVSEVARIFDPLGLINPVVVVSKILIQKLWKH
jgi:hypothetical protein